MSGNAKISHSESISRIFRDIAISTHKNGEIFRAVYFVLCVLFSLVFFCILQICEASVTERHTDTQIHGQTLLKDASCFKKSWIGLTIRKAVNYPVRRYKINFMFCVTRKNRRPATRFISIIFVHPAGNLSCICLWMQRKMT